VSDFLVQITDPEIKTAEPKQSRPYGRMVTQRLYTTRSPADGRW
jgi:hypothetical protein